MSTSQSPDGPAAKNQRSLNPKQGLRFALLLGGIALLFAFLIAPYLRPKRPLVATKALPDVSLPLLSGGEAGDRIRLADLRGKVVLLDFWASWCRPCREQSVEIRAALAKFGPEVVVLGVDGSESEEDARKYLAAEAPPYSNAFDAGGEFLKQLGVTELPSLYVVDKEGAIVAEAHRLVGRDEIVQMIEGAKR